jgi:hypothetical protein
VTDDTPPAIREAIDRLELLQLQASDVDLPNALSDRILAVTRYDAVVREIADVRVRQAEILALLAGDVPRDPTPRLTLVSDERADEIRETVATRVELDALDTAAQTLAAAIAIQHTQEPTG